MGSVEVVASSGLSRVLRSDSLEEAVRVLELVHSYGGELVPRAMSGPDEGDDFSVRGIKPEQMDEFRSAVAQIPGISAAYTKPPDALP
ncbi:hypothetical protein KCG44_02220 [Pacificimonas sp. WHA3]|uniref:Uncharacterized protein n=1 Tax=Pacificimonas pallii TaxID=2827236 RepID=A0ABS6SCE3_9SPHN|nr:hypothetical protein [Pacificimonas pallii]MBV7255596.1 hypothetical protein [Pacificimonas pallii]